MMSGDSTLLEVRDLHLQRDDREILRGCTLTLAPGEIHAILGLNGSGKSTLAYALMGSAGYRPDQGAIFFDEQDITDLDIAERGKLGITLAWQEPARFEGLTVARYLSLGMQDPEMDRIRAALESVLLNPDTYLSRYVDESLSGGERKRIELAAVYAMGPRLAILDEPDSGVDLMSMDEIGALIERMAQEGTTVLLISHHNDIVRLAHSASLMCEGEIVNTDKPNAVCDLYNRWCEPCDGAEQVEEEGDYERL